MKEYIVQAIERETIESFDAHNAPELVRCKDCKWHTMRGEMLLCTAQDKPHTYDWFCADGKRK